MFEVMGFMFMFLFMGWASIVVFFATVPTFGEALFSNHNICFRLFGVLLWVALIAGWVWLLGHISIDFN